MARHFVELGVGLDYVHRVAGDLVEFDNGGKYTYETDVVDLATLRFTPVVSDTAAAPGRALIGSGAIVETAFPVALFGGDDDPASGVYTTLGDGLSATATFDASLVRPDRATWSRLRREAGTRRVNRTFKTAGKPGVIVTPLLGSDVQLEAHRATRHAPAALWMRCPAITAYGRYDGADQTDLIGRLVPGSQAEAQSPAPGVVVGRFLDHPAELRLRVWTPSRRDARIRLDMTAPTAGTLSHAVAVGGDATAVAGPDVITLLTRDRQSGADRIETLPIPHATDLALTTTPDGQNYQYVLYYRDETGTPQRHAFSQPEA